MQIQNNFFDYAAGGLSQDAFLCWFFSFAKKEFNAHDEDPGGEISCLAKKFLREAWPEKLGGLSDEELKVTAVLKQYKNIDVLIKVNDLFSIIITDEPCADVHGWRINAYEKTLICEGKTSLENIRCIFYKTADNPHIEPDAVSRTWKDMLAMLNQYKGNNLIVLSYRQHLQDMENALNSWQAEPIENWNSQAWTGFFSHIAESGMIDYSNAFKYNFRYDGWKCPSDASRRICALWWKSWKEGLGPGLERKGLLPAIDVLYLLMTSQRHIELCFSCENKNYSALAHKWIERWFANYLKEKYGLGFHLPKSKRLSLGGTYSIGYISFDKENYKEMLSAMENAYDAFCQDREKFQPNTDNLQIART